MVSLGEGVWLVAPCLRDCAVAVAVVLLLRTVGGAAHVLGVAQDGVQLRTAKDCREGLLRTDAGLLRMWLRTVGSGSAHVLGVAEDGVREEDAEEHDGERHQLLHLVGRRQHRLDLALQRGRLLRLHRL